MIAEHQVTQGSEAWLQARIGRFTGSNAYKLLGSFGASEYAKAIEQSFKGNFYTKRGATLEPQAIELYERITKTKVSTCGFVTNSKYPTALYSPDALTDTLVIEVKCFNEQGHSDIAKGDIPLKVLAQIYFGMLITERKAAHLVIYNPDLDAKDAFKIIPIKYNPAIQANFRRILNTASVSV